MLSKNKITRRNFLIAAGAATASSITSPSHAFLAAGDPAYLIIADARHATKRYSQRDYEVFDDAALLHKLSKQDYRAIAFELPHDFPAVMQRGWHGIIRHVRQCCEQAGMEDEPRIVATVNKYLWFADVMQSTANKAARHGITVSTFDPWSVEKAVVMSAHVDTDPEAYKRFMQERYSDSVHQDMVDRIKDLPMNAAIYTGRRHARDISRLLREQTGRHSHIRYPHHMTTARDDTETGPSPDFG